MLCHLLFTMSQALHSLVFNLYIHIAYARHTLCMRIPSIHVSLGFMVWLQGWTLRTSKRVIIVNYKSQTNMHYVVYSPTWLVLVAIDKHSITVNKVVHRTHHFTTSCDIRSRIYKFLSVPVCKIIPTCYCRNKGEVETICCWLNYFWVV